MPLPEVWVQIKPERAEAQTRMWGAPLPRTLPNEVPPIKEDRTGELLKAVEYYEKLLKLP